MSTCVCLLSVCGLCARPQSLEEGVVRSPEARATGRHRLFTEGAGNQSARAASALSQSSSHFSSFHRKFLALKIFFLYWGRKPGPLTVHRQFLKVMGLRGG